MSSKNVQNERYYNQIIEEAGQKKYCYISESNLLVVDSTDSDWL